MRYDRVLLIRPPYYKSHYQGPNLPAGVGYISEILNYHVIENTVFDFHLGYKFRDLVKRIKEFDPDLIGVSMMSFRFLDNYQLIKDIKKLFPDISILFGGPHISTLRGRVLEECGDVDFGITLEGEETIIELCKGERNLIEIKGLFFRKNGEVIYNGDREFISDLDGISFPRFSKFEIEKYPFPINIVSSRGCPYNCVYCPVSLAIGRKFRARSAKNVVDELEWWYKRGKREFEFVDDNFTLMPERVFEICDEIERRNLRNLRLSCGNGVRADKVDYKMLKRMKEVGWYLIAFGVESADPEVLKRLRKEGSIDKIKDVISSASGLGYQVELFFLLGSPGEDENKLRKSFKLALSYPIARANFYNIIPFPGTQLFNWVDEKNLFIHPYPEYLNAGSHWDDEPIFETPELPYCERKKWLRYTHTRLQRLIRLNYLKYKFNQIGVKNSWARIFSWLYFYLSKGLLGKILTRARKNIVDIRS